MTHPTPTATMAHYPPTATCGAPNATGGLDCRNRVGRYGGHCWLHRDTEALRAEVDAWCHWTADTHHVGYSDGEAFVGGLVGARGELRDWTPALLASALDAAVASLGFDRWPQ